MTAVVAWVAFVAVLVELVVGAAAVVLARRAWRQIGPQVKPLLAMFTPPAPPASVIDPAPPKSPPGR